MKKYIFIVLSALFLLVGCGLSSGELKAKNEALEIAKVGTFVVVDRVIGYRGACIITLGDPSSQKRWAATFDGSIGASFHECMTLAQRDMVKVTFRDMETYSSSENSYNIGGWLNIERLPFEFFLPKL